MSCANLYVVFFFWFSFRSSSISREIIVCLFVCLLVSICWFGAIAPSSPSLVWGAAKIDCIYHHHNHVTHTETTSMFVVFEWWSLLFVILEIHKRYSLPGSHRCHFGANPCATPKNRIIPVLIDCISIVELFIQNLTSKNISSGKSNIQWKPMRTKEQKK